MRAALNENVVFVMVRFLETNPFSMLPSPGRRDTLLEKPIIPPEPPEPVLHGSMAIGAVSLAVAKASARLAGTPLYMSMASLKHGQVSGQTLHPVTAWSLEWGGARELPFSPSLAFLTFQEPPSMLTMPLVMGSVLSCGKSSPGKLNLMKEVICIPHPGLTTKQVPDIS